MDFKKKVEFRRKLHEDLASLKLSLDENGEVTWPRKEQEKNSRTGKDTKKIEKDQNTCKSSKGKPTVNLNKKEKIKKETSENDYDYDIDTDTDFITGLLENLLK